MHGQVDDTSLKGQKVGIYEELCVLCYYLLVLIVSQIILKLVLIQCVDGMRSRNHCLFKHNIA